MDELLNLFAYLTEGYKLVFGSIVRDNDGNFFIEIFREIKTPDDLPTPLVLNLRSRFNPKRDYKFFYFRTLEFEKLKAQLDKDNRAFADWIRTTRSVKYITF